MKKFVLFFGLFLMSFGVFAQELNSGWYGGFGFTGGDNRRFSGVVGLSVGLELPDMEFGCGVYFTHLGTVSKPDNFLAEDFSDGEFRFRSYYGGIYAEKLFYCPSLLSFSVGSKLGFGGLNYSNDDVDKEFYDLDGDVAAYTYMKADKCFIMALEPFAFINFDIGESFRLSAGVEYRNLVFANLDYCGYNIAGGDDLNGVVYMLKMAFRVGF